MKLQFHISAGSEFPMRGFLIQNSSPRNWVKALQELKIEGADVQLFPVPGITPNSVWACLVVAKNTLTKELVGRHELCQQVFPNLFISPGTRISPDLTIKDRERIFSTGTYLFHPAIGLAELDPAFQIGDLIHLPDPKGLKIQAPLEGEFLPERIKSFQVIPIPPEELIERMENKVVPPLEKKESKPLSFIEKAKLFLYKHVFLKQGNRGAQSTEMKTWSRKLFAKLGLFEGPPEKVEDQAIEDYEDLAKRNRDEMDKLLDLLDNKPDEALYYAVPLDENATGRGSTKGTYQHTRRWWDLSYRDGNRLSSGGGATLSDSYDQLSQKYHKIATDFVEKAEFEKSAFVYLKLLKDPFNAAKVLEKGAFYQEAAAIYEEKCNLLPEAATCYEKGKMYEKAIELYESLGRHEQAGDLYLRLNRHEEGMQAYGIAAQEYERFGKYLLAAKLYQDKVNDLKSAQMALHTGWKKHLKARECLDKYLNNIPDPNHKKHEIQRVLKEEVDDANAKTFLLVILDEFDKGNELETFLKEMSYQLISYRSKSDSGVLKFLRRLSPENDGVVKDIIRYKDKRR